MALVNPSSLYSAGNVKLDSSPYVNFATQLMAKQQAKRDALDQYYQKALTDVTPAGMRNKDVTGGWAKKLSDWQAYGMNPANRKYLDNPRLDHYKTLTEFNRMHTDLLTDAARSKQELADEKIVNAQRISGKWNPTDDDIDIAHRKGLSIYDPARRDQAGNDPDLSQLSFNIPEFDPTKQTAYYKASVGDLKPVYNDAKKVIDNKTGEIFLTKEYTPKQLNTIAENAGNLINSDKSAKIHYEHLLHDNNFMQNALPIYQSVYPNDIIDTPQKAAKADALVKASSVSTQEKIVDPNYRSQLTLTRQKIMEGIRQNDRVALAGIRRNWQVLDQQAQNDILDGVVNDYVKNPTQIPEDILNSYKKTDDKGHKVDFESVKVSPDGTKVQMIVKDSKGNPDPTFSSEASIADLKERTRKKIETAQTNTHVAVPTKSTTSATYEVKGKKYTEAELLKLGYTIDQIKPYRK